MIKNSVVYTVLLDRKLIDEKLKKLEPNINDIDLFNDALRALPISKSTICHIAACFRIPVDY